MIVASGDLSILEEGKIKELKLEQVFIKLPIFLENYRYYTSHQKFITFINILGLGAQTNVFIDAAKTKQSSIKYTAPVKQNELNQVFDVLLTPDGACTLFINIDKKDESTTKLKNIALKEEHLDNIYTAFNFTSEISTEKAKLLLSLAELFAKYSSSSIFGTDDDSPDALRRYSYALMKAANGLDKTVVPDKNFTAWQNILLGIDEAFSCTSVLAYKIKLITDTFSEIRSMIMPPIWS